MIETAMIILRLIASLLVMGLGVLFTLFLWYAVSEITEWLMRPLVER